VSEQKPQVFVPTVIDGQEQHVPVEVAVGMRIDEIRGRQLADAMRDAAVHAANAEVLRVQLNNANRTIAALQNKLKAMADAAAGAPEKPGEDAVAEKVADDILASARAKVAEVAAKAAK
jgi:hypothetical protein